jgi:trimethylamine--corrinoid protein Co-methyltransferase
LDEESLESIHQASLTILEEIGLDFLDAEALSLNSIAAVGPGGHHFATAHTQARFRSEHYQSPLADRQSFDSWVENGSEDTVQRAHCLWRTALAAYTPPPMDEAVREVFADYVARRAREPKAPTCMSRCRSRQHEA